VIPIAVQCSTMPDRRSRVTAALLPTSFFLLSVCSLQLATPEVFAQEPADAEVETPAPSPSPESAPEAEAGRETITLEAIPPVDLSALEPAVTEQLGEVRAALDILLQQAGRADAAALGEELGNVGRYYHAYQLVEPAAACYRNAIRLRPDDARWPHLLGRLLQAAGRLPEASMALELAIERAPDDAAAHVYLAEVRQLQGRPADARQHYERALEQRPGDPAALAGLGQASLEAGDAALAAERLEAALAATPGADRLHYPLGLAYRQLGDEEKARQHLLAAGSVGVRPVDPLVDSLEELKSGERAHLLRGHMAFRAGHYGEAANSYHRAVREVPDSAAAHLDLATAMARLGYTEGAEEELRTALALDSASATAHYNLGALMLGRREIAGALVHLRRAIALDPEDGAAHAALGQALIADGDTEAALGELQRAERLGAPSETGFLLEAQLLADRGRYAHTRKLLEHAFETIPSSVPILHALARVLAASPDYAVRDAERALDLAERAYAAGQTLAHGETMALALGQAGRCEEAAEWQARLIDVARSAGAADLVPGYEQDLERYRAGAPCAPPAAAGGEAAAAPAEPDGTGSAP
jgi:tetratricopeptide (TPR) repeat protein